MPLQDNIDIHCVASRTSATSCSCYREITKLCEKVACDKNREDESMTSLDHLSDQRFSFSSVVYGDKSTAVNWKLSMRHG